MFGFFKKAAKEPAGPDFSAVTSLDKAEEMRKNGQLEKLLMRPPELGGEDHFLNTLYVPVGVAAMKSRIDAGQIVPLVEAGKVTKFKASPEYQGDSVIPIAIKITASDPGQFSWTINIWGEALKRK